MNITSEEYKQYIEDKLTPTRQKELAAYFAKNPLEERALKGLLVSGGPSRTEDLLARLEASIDQKVEASSPQKNSSFKKIWWFTLAAVLIASLYFILRNEPPASQIEYATYFEPYPDVLTSTLRSEENETASTITRAMEAYNQGDFSSSSPLIREAIDENNVDKRLPFYLAISLMGEGKYASAYDMLTTLENEPSYPYMDGVIWNKALAALALQKNDEAKKLLSQIVSENVYMRSEANEILKKLSIIQ